MTENDPRTLSSLLTDFDTAMLVTRASDGELRSRPMMIADKEGEAELWFVTSIASGKVDEIKSDQRVNVALQEKNAYVSVSGVAYVVRDRAKLDALWQERWKTWFPNGKDDPQIALIRVVPESAEYWDMRGTKGARYAWEAAKAYVQGHKPNEAKGTHGSFHH